MRKMNRIKTIAFLLLLPLAFSIQLARAQYGNTPPLHREGNQLKDPHGNTVVLHGVMDTPSPYFNSYRWGNSCNSSTVTPCINYFNKLFTAITDTTSGAYCNLFRLHLDPCWTNDPNKPRTGSEGGEANISQFSATRLKTYLRSLYTRIAVNAVKHGLYVVIRPPGVFPGEVKVGDEYNEYLMTVWDIVSQNDTIKKYSGQISLELGNEPVNLKDANGQNNVTALHDFFQPIVNKIRENGFTGIIWIPGTGWQSNYRDFATCPIEDENMGYAVHDYTGWYGASDNSYNTANYIRQFKEQVPVVETHPIVITEVDWSPEKEGTGHYNEHGDWVTSNYGTWSTGSTSKWGKAYKALLDHYGNISMTLSGTACYIDIDQYIKNNKVVPAYKTDMENHGLDPYEACGVACFDWYKQWANVNAPHPDYKKQYTADTGYGYFLNPLINADFPDPDIILVGDTYYLCSTTMFYFPGATILKSKDLVNWEYCANPLQQIADDDPHNLMNGQNRYSKGQWAPSLQYHNGKFYLNFIAFSADGYDDGGDWILSATDPEGEWTMTKLDGFYYDSGFLFDDNRDHLHGLGENGEPYEESSDRVFKNQKIHQGGLVQTQMGEWWTILFKDAGTVGRIPYLEPVKWVDGWPVLGNNGTDVTAAGKPYAKPNVGKTYPKTYLPTNDTFTEPRLGLQWEWNHNPDNSAWSLFDNPGHLRLHTASLTNELSQARNMLTQRIFGYNIANTISSKYPDSYGTISLDTYGMQDGDVAGLCVFQDPYGYIGVKQVDGKKYFVQYRSAYDNTAATEKVGEELTQDKVFLRIIANFGTNKASFYYSYDNQTWRALGSDMTMRYTLKIFVGNRFGIFNYATKSLGVGYVDVDWFSTEPVYSEDRFFGEGVLKTYTKEDLTLTSLSMPSDGITVLTGSSSALNITATYQSGLTQNVSSSCTYSIANPSIATIVGGRVVSQMEGSTEVTATYTDINGTTQSVTFTVTVSTFPLTADAFNPSIYGSGKFTEKTGALQTSQYGFGGWEYGSGLDLSAYNYIVVKLRRSASCNPSFRIFDNTSYWSTPYMADMGTSKQAVVDLHNMKKSDGSLADPSHIYIVGFWTTGTSAVYISEVYLSNDGTTPLAILDPVSQSLVKSIEYFSLDGRRITQPAPNSIVIVRKTLMDGSISSDKVIVKGE